jgi:hypothetical protein
MKRTITAAAAFLTVTLSAGAAAAGPYADGLAKCLVDSSSGKDREVFMQWMFSALAANPSVRSMTTITDAQRDTMNREVARVMERLILVDCHKESVLAIKNEGMRAFSQAFEGFGRIAVTDLMANPDVSKVLEGIGPYIDQSRWEALGKEAAAKP